MKRIALSLLAIVAVAAMWGCKPEIRVAIRTKVLADGTTVRETRIHKIANRDATGDGSEAHRRPISDDFPRDFGERFATKTVTDSEIVLGGTFPSPDAVPSDFERAVDVVKGVSRNRVSFVREDILFGTRCLYRERFADAIVPEDLAAARDELVDLCIRFVKAAARIELGRDWNLDGFDAWAGTELRKVTVELLDAFYEERHEFGRKDPHTGESGWDRFRKRAYARLERVGLHLEEPIDAPLNRLFLQAWICETLAQKLTRRTDGRPAKGEEFRYLLPDEGEDPWRELSRIVEQTAAREYGSVDAAGEAFQRALYAVTGTFDSADCNYRFDCAIEMPGLLLRTNGVVEGEHGAFFLFEGDDLFPRGVTIELESVVLDESLTSRIPELKLRLDRRDAAWLIDRLGDKPPSERAELRAALEQCAAHGSLDWLDKKDDPERAKLKERLAPILEVVRP